MWVQIKIKAIMAVLLAGIATVAYAQGSTTENPGRMAPGNLWTDRLGPNNDSAANGGRSGAEDTGLH